jgi:hypothetical protein
MDIGTIIALMAIVIGGLGTIALENGFKLKNTDVSDLSSVEVKKLISLTLDVCAEREGVKSPKFQITDLSKHAKLQNEHVLGMYLCQTKMIFIDVERFIYRGDNIGNMVSTIVHEFQHYVDDLNGSNETNTVLDLLELRADNAEVKYLKKTIRRLHKIIEGQPNILSLT